MTDDLNAPLDGYTPETLLALATRTEDLRHDALFGIDDAGADPISEQHYLTALALLDQAVQQFKLARLHHVRALAGR